MATNRISNTGTGTMPNHGQRAYQHQLQRRIKQQWELVPKQAKQLLIEVARPVDLHALAQFWSLPTWREFTQGDAASILRSTSWRLALGYLKLGKVKEARALTLNGAFMTECVSTPIENIVKMCGASNLPLFSEALHSLRSPQAMEAYCLEQLPNKNQYVIGSPLNNDHSSVMKYVDQIGDSWGGDSSTRQHHTPSPNTAATETQIQLILVCDANTEERHHLSIGSSTPLKILFNDYARERGDSLRSLRFSYSGHTLFLSSAGNKTPEQLNMQDQDIITVHGTSAPRETGGDRNSSDQKSTQALKVTPTKTQTKKTKGKGKKKKKSKQKAPIKTLLEWQAQHSNKLSKLHEEVHSRLKDIRTRLNALDLKCQRPKQKRKTNGKTKAKDHVDNNQRLPHSGLGGKAGKVFFSVQVGEVQHLYKPTHTPAPKKARDAATALLDLHGCTREEALRKLDARLPVWMDVAMRGAYPFVTPGTIVCGGGGQLLSETVERWIREHAQVANAMQAASQ